MSVAPVSAGPAWADALAATWVPQTGQVHILLVEDEEQIRMLTQVLLEKLGYRVTAVASGEQALEAYEEACARREPFALVITDLRLSGGMAGDEVARSILSAHPAARMVLTSGCFDLEPFAHFREHGFRAALRKPYFLEDLQRTVREVLG